MANDFIPGEGVEPEKKRAEVTTDTKLSIGTKVALTVIVVGTVAAGVYLALSLAR
jgi:hypothetical protein